MIRHHVLRRTLLVGMLAALAATGCGRIAVWAAPEKIASAERTSAAVEADKLFWAALRGGAYDRISETLTALTAAYLANPNDAVPVESERYREGSSSSGGTWTSASRKPSIAPIRTTRGTRDSRRGRGRGAWAGRRPRR